MKHINVLALLALMPVAVLAANFDDEVNAELDRMYKATAAQSSSTSSGAANRQEESPAAVQVNVNNTNTARATSEPRNEQAQNQVQAQKQPTTVIEASPLVESRADRIRKARQDVEVQTEQRIVEKLEMSRIEDERRRAEVLFGDKFNQINGINGNNNTVIQQQTAPQVVAPVVAQPVAPAPIIAVPKEEKTVEVLPVVETSTIAVEPPAKKTSEDKWQIGALLGVGEYPDVKNVKGSYALGVLLGRKFQDRMVVEGSFIYSNFQVEQVYGGGYDIYGQYYPRITEMDQYQGAATAKFQLGGASIRPVIGATMAYTYRSFTDTQFAMYNSDATSTAIDIGAVTGVDFELSESFTLGLDFRYMWNVSSRTSGTFQRSTIYGNSNQSPIEKLSYYTLGIVGKSSF